MEISKKIGFETAIVTFLRRSIFFALVMLTLTDLKATPDTVIGWINNQPIEKKELVFFWGHSKSTVYSYFLNKYELRDSVFRWDKRYGREIPEEVLLKEALEELIYHKIQQILFMEAGLLTDLSFEAFRQRWEIENEQRKCHAEEGEVVFGPIQFSERAFFYHSFNLMKTQYLKKISAGFSDSLLFKHYERIKSLKLKQQDGSFFSFDDSRELVARDYSNQEYEKLIKRRLTTSKVIISDSLIESIK